MFNAIHVCLSIFVFALAAATDKVLAGNGPIVDKSVCTFGALRLKVGDLLNSVNDPCTVCTCNIPPFVECIKTLNCQL